MWGSSVYPRQTKNNNLLIVEMNLGAVGDVCLLKHIPRHFYGTNTKNGIAHCISLINDKAMLSKYSTQQITLHRGFNGLISGQYRVGI